MKEQLRLLSLPAIVMAVLTSMLSTNTANAMGTDLVWTVVTSEADSGPGTLRQAILDVNGGGTNDPNAIAFAKSVNIIKLESLLPIITEPVLIDGLAVVSNGTVIQEGNCDSLPSPVDNPCEFSCALRVTIDGSNIPITESPNTRYGLSISSEGSIIRGLCITNITTPDLGSVAVGILSDNNNNLIECSEVREIRNAAGPGSFSNFAVGILSSEPLIVNKSYIHNIQGGSITIDCNDTLGSDTEFFSGAAFGISTEGSIIDTRVEQIESGNIVTCQPASTSEETIGLLVGASIGITNNLSEFIELINLRSKKVSKKDCPLADTTDCSLCSITGSQIALSVENSIVTNISGGSIVTNLPYSSIIQNYVSGIGTSLSSQNYFFIRYNSISKIQTGSASLSGDNATIARLGAQGILSLVGNGCINNNTINNVELGSLNLSGSSTIAITGFAHGISLGIANDAFIECNTISNISGGHTAADGNCSKALSASIEENISLNRTKKTKKGYNNKYIPAGIACNLVLPFSVTGIYVPICLNISINNNNVQTISGIKHTVRGEGAEALTLGSAGIAVGREFADETIVSGNSVNSIVGPELVAFAGTGKIQNLQGSAGINANGFTVEVTDNCVNNVHEGKMRLQNNSIVAHYTNQGALDLFRQLRSVEKLHNKTPFATNAETFVPAVTVGIAVSGNNILLKSMTRNNKNTHKNATSALITIQDNRISNISGATVPGGQLPQGSVAAGIAAQPSLNQLQNISLGTADLGSNIPVPLLTACDAAEDLIGVICNNTIDSVSAGTHAPGYGILLDGSQLFLESSNTFGPNVFTLGLFEVANNIIKKLKGNGRIQPFTLTEDQLSSLHACCVEVNGTDGTECNLTTDFIPLLPFEPTSGIYSLFGNCSTLNANTIIHVTDSTSDARGITTAASSDTNIFDNTLSQIKGYGIFVGGSVVDNTIASGSEFVVDQILPSVRNKIYNNSTTDNTNKGIELGLIDWNAFLFAQNTLGACSQGLPPILARSHQENVNDATTTYGNHGQVAPCIKKVICNSNGTVTVEVKLNNTLRLTNFVIQFFRNSTNVVPHGEQHISSFNDPQFLLTTDINGNAHARFTFLPLAKIESSDTISAHVTVQDVTIAREEFLGDTSEFSDDNTQFACPLSGLTQKPNNSNKPGFSNLLYRTSKQDDAQEATA